MFFQILDNSYGPTNQWPLFFMLFFVLLFIWFIWILVFMFFPIFSLFFLIWILVFILFSLFFSFSFSCGFRCSFLLLHLHVHVVSLFHFFVYHLFFWFHFFIYMFMLSDMSIFHLVFFRCVCPVHCVLVSHCAVLCLFPVCVYVHSNCFFCKKYPNIFPRHFG